MAEFQDYTISNVMATGEESEKFGHEYYVKFAESADTVKVWRKTEPKEGDVWNGKIDGNKFVKPPYNPEAKKTAPAASTKATGYKRVDNSDGQRQGMCINNAANYVNNTQGDKLEAKDWANMVHSFAQALYNKGDLTKTEGSLVDDVNAVFNLDK